MKLDDVFADLPRLETGRTILRKVCRYDAEDFFAICSDEETARFTTWEKHNTIEDTRRFIHLIMQSYANHQVTPWGIEDKQSGKFIGTCGFAFWNVWHSRAEIASALSRELWGKGYMTEVTKKVIEFGFAKMDLVRIEARCLIENAGAARVLEKAGLSLEGILRKQIFAKGIHHDVKMYAIVK